MFSGHGNGFAILKEFMEIGRTDQQMPRIMRPDFYFFGCESIAFSISKLAQPQNPCLMPVLLNSSSDSQIYGCLTNSISGFLNPLQILILQKLSEGASSIDYAQESRKCATE